MKTAVLLGLQLGTQWGRLLVTPWGRQLGSRRVEKSVFVGRNWSGGGGRNGRGSSGGRGRGWRAGGRGG
jgi:hypothetical protein